MNEENKKNRSEIFRGLVKKAGKAAKVAEKASKKVAQNAISNGKKLKIAASYEHLLQWFDTPDTYPIYFQFLETLKKNNIDPNHIRISDYSTRTNTISFSLTYHTTKSGKIQTTPSRYSYYIKGKKLVDEYHETIKAQKIEEEYFQHK